MDVLGSALLDYYHNRYTENIVTRSSISEDDELPLPYLFRTFEEMPKLEQKALRSCKGNVLDVGCGSGAHSLYLQNQGLEVTALDNSSGAIEVCRLRGLKSTIEANIHHYSGCKYDTLLLLMNGIGLAGTLNALPSFLQHLKSLLQPSGQILLDSSDIIYMFDQDSDGGYWIDANDSYYGEVFFEMSYKGQVGPRFNWLYLDFNSLSEAAKESGFHCEKLLKGPHYDYLAKLTLLP